MIQMAKPMPGERERQAQPPVPVQLSLCPLGHGCRDQLMDVAPNAQQ